MNGNLIAPTEVKPNRRYWLRADGAAFEVADHLLAAQYAKADSDEYERPLPWSYEDMFRQGWIRVHIEGDRIWADLGEGCVTTPSQQEWIAACRHNIAGQTGLKVQVGSAVMEQASVLGRSDASISPTQKFLRKLGFGRGW